MNSSIANSICFCVRAVRSAVGSSRMSSHRAWDIEFTAYLRVLGSIAWAERLSDAVHDFARRTASQTHRIET